MEVKQGYKQSEIGVIPEDWAVSPISALAEKIMVGIASAATHAYRDRGIVMFRNQNLKPGCIDDSDILYIAADYEIAFRNKRLKSGDILIARTGYPGTAAVVPPQYGGAQSFTTLIVRPSRDLIDSTYLCFFINSESGQRYFEQNQAGGPQKNVNAGSLRFLPVPVPPTKAEQGAIAQALSDADALIRSLEQLLAKKLDIKQGAVQELLTGMKRLPGFAANKDYKQTEAGVIPEDWDVQTLGSIASIASGGTPSRRMPEYWNGDIPWVTTTEIAFNTIRETEQSISILGLKNSAARLLAPGTLLLALYGQGKTRGKVAILGIQATTNQACASIVLSPGVSLSFIFYFLSSQYRAIRGMSNSGSQENLSGQIVKSIVVSLPSTKAEQDAIAAGLSELDAEIATLEERLAKVRLVKKGMMHELLTGRIRVV